MVVFWVRFLLCITREKMKSSVKVRFSHCFCSSASVSILPPLLGSHIYYCVNLTRKCVLVCYLVGWDNKAVAQNGAMAGALFETFVVSEIVKSWINKGLDVRNIFFYRDSNQKEIDLLIRRNATIFPIEIKMTATPTVSMARRFPVLKEMDNMETGTILCQCEKNAFISSTVQVLPIEMI